jgi:ribonuclease R
MRKKKKTEEPVRKRKKKELASAIIQFLNDNADKQYNYKQISAALDVSAEERRTTLRDVLDKLRDDELVLETQRGKYKTNNRKPVLEGRFERRSNGKNFFVPNDEGNIVYIPERNAMHAMNGDIVRVQLFAKRKRAESEGEVIEILKRTESRFVGTLQVQKDFGFLVLDSRILANDIFIPKENLKGGKNGDKAVVEIIEWPLKANNPIGKVLDVLGEAGENTTEMHAILAQYGLPYEYPKKVEDAAEKISAGITPEEIAKREDMRKVFTMTIDPADAKDFDDALSIKELSPTTWEIGVHIADVTHYVKPSDIIDEEAQKRATSIYLVDRTIPMLPERLSNELCSLRPNEDKLCFSVIFEMNDKGHVLKHRIAKTVINSDVRMAYEDAQKIIDTEKGNHSKQVLIMNSIAKQLRERRFANGAIGLSATK